MEKIKGFNDWTEKEAKKREKIVETLKKNFKLYNFEPAETPIIEKENFVKKGDENDEAISDVYTLKDKGERKLALRYEFTFQLERISKNKKLPYKRYQIGPVFRDEPIKGNRFRQFTQCDVDVVGSTKKEEVEILALTSRTLNELNIDFQINVNNRKLMNEILEDFNVNEKDKNEVIRVIDKLDKKPEKEIGKELEKYDCQNILSVFKKEETFFEKYKSYNEIKELKENCKNYNIKINFQPSLARGLSYYNGSVYEVKTKKMKETICAGGSYLANKTQSTGISFGLERLSELTKINLKEKNVLIISINQEKKSAELAENLRNKKIETQIYYNKISKGLEYANSKNISFVIILGKEEVEKNKVKLKNMNTGKEKLTTEKELYKEISKD